MPYKFNPKTKKFDYYEKASATAAATVTNETTWGISPAVGTATTYAREDHTHGSPTAPSGTGDVTGPAGAVDSNFASFNTTTGKIIKDSGKSAGSFVEANTAITGATKTKITYDTKGLVTAGADATASDVGAEPTGAVSTHAALTTGVHGAGGSTLATTANITTHAALTSSVHGFDSSGNAPAQTHDNTRHSTAYAPDADLTTAEKQLYNVMSTGLKKGGTITVNGTLNYRFDLAAGSGVVVNNYTDADNPTATNVSWSAFTNQTLTYLATDDETSIGINSSGAIVQQVSGFTEDDLHDIIQIGTIGHFSRTKIDYIIMEPARIADVMGQLQGFWESFGAFNTTGNEFTANGANMKINKSGGSIFDNETGTTKVPNILSISAGTAVYFQYYYQSSPNVWVFGNYTDTVDDLKYDTGSGLGTIPVGNFSIQTFFLYGPLFGTGLNGEYGVDVQYGQTYYATMTAAQQAITSSIKLNPYLSFDVFRTWLIVKRGTTSLQNASDAMFIQAPPLKFGTMAATGGGSTGEVNTASNVGTAGVGFYRTKTGVDLEFKNAEAASTKVTVTDYPTNQTVRFDVVEANFDHMAAASPHSGHPVAVGFRTITVGTTAPGSPVAGDLWVDTN